MVIDTVGLGIGAVGPAFQPVNRAVGVDPRDPAATSEPRAFARAAQSASGQENLYRQRFLGAAQAEACGSLGGITATEAPPDTEEQHAKQWPIPDDVLHDKLIRPCQGRPYYIRYAFKMGWTVEQVHELTRIDPWFLDQMMELVETEENVETLKRRNVKKSKSQNVETSKQAGSEWDADVLRAYKQLGYSDVQLAAATGATPGAGASPRETSEAFKRIAPVYKLVDTCAAEFEARTPYYYSTHESETIRLGDVQGSASQTWVDDEIRISDKPKVIVLGGGPNRIGQGIEFDYCCCHASYAAREAGYESVMINSNPETVSTDFDTSDMLFFEPLTHEDVLNVIERLSERFLRHRDSGDDQVCDARTARLGKHGAEAQVGDAHPTAAHPAAFDSAFPIPHSPFPGPGLDGGRGRVRGVIVQFGGQTPLNLAQGLKDAGVPILGTQPEMIHLAEDRDEFQKVLRDLSLLQPPNGIARSSAEALRIAERIGYPILVRPSYVLGGRGMKVCNNERDLDDYLHEAFGATDRAGGEAKNPLLIDKFLVDAIEVDVDAIADFGRVDAQSGAGLPLFGAGEPTIGAVELAFQPVAKQQDQTADHTSRFRLKTPSPFQGEGWGEGLNRMIHPSPSPSPQGERSSQAERGPTCIVAGIMEHIEEAGIHSGDSTCVLPPFSLGRSVVEELFRSTKRLAKRLNVCGAMNVQYAILNRTVYVLEVNPRASRTLPFVAKATGVPWARIATRVMLGEPLTEILAAYGVSETPWPSHTAVKAPVFPFSKFPGVDVILGPEMRSTGEVMGIAPTFGQAFAKAQIATGLSLPTRGNVLISVNDPDKPRIVSVARDFHDLGFRIFSTVGTRNILAEAGIPATLVSKSSDSGDAPFLKNLIDDGTLHLLINTPIHTGPASAEGRWRASAASRRIPLITTLAGARAAVAGIRALRKSEASDELIPLAVKPLQAYFEE